MTAENNKIRVSALQLICPHSQSLTYMQGGRTIVLQVVDGFIGLPEDHRRVRENRVYKPFTRRQAASTASSIIGRDSFTQLTRTADFRTQGPTTPQLPPFCPEFSAGRGGSSRKAIRDRYRHAHTTSPRQKTATLHVVFLANPTGHETSYGSSGQYTLGDGYVDICSDDTEDIIKDKICGAAKMISDYEDTKSGDIIFMKCHNRTVTFPVVAPDFQWTGTKLKQLYGQGRLHVQIGQLRRRLSPDSRRGRNSSSRSPPAATSSRARSRSPTTRRPTHHRPRSPPSPTGSYSSRFTRSPTPPSPTQRRGRSPLPSTSRGHNDLPAYCPSPRSPTPPPSPGPCRRRSPVPSCSAASRPLLSDAVYTSVMGCLEENEAIQMAVNASLETFSGSENERESSGRRREMKPEELMGLLQAHCSQLVPEGTEVRRVIVKRTAPWLSILRFLQLPSFARRKGFLDVTFAMDMADEDGTDSTEMALDMGGPRREFFRMVLDQWQKPSFPALTGHSKVGFTLKPSLRELNDNTYRMMGRMIAMMIVQGGEPPRLFTPSLVDVLLDEEEGDPLQDILDDKKEDITKVADAEDEEGFMSALSDCTWLAHHPEVPSFVRFEDRQEWAVLAASYFVKHAILPYTAQLKEGLEETYDMLEWLKQNSARQLLEFELERALSAAQVLKVLKPKYSQTSQRERTQQELVYANLEMFLRNIEARDPARWHEALDDGEEVEPLQDGERYIVGRELEQFLLAIEPRQLLIFATGAGGVPTTGFDPHPRTEFVVTDDRSVLPSATTCSNTLYLPVNRKTINPMIFSRALAHALIAANNFFGKM